MTKYSNTNKKAYASKDILLTFLSHQDIAQAVLSRSILPDRLVATCFELSEHLFPDNVETKEKDDDFVSEFASPSSMILDGEFV